MKGGLLLYVVISQSPFKMQKYNEVDANVAYSVVFKRLGMKWVKYLVSICVLIDMSILSEVLDMVLELDLMRSPRYGILT